MLRLLVVVLAAALLGAAGRAREIVPTLPGDGTTPVTATLQAAIDAAHAAGGGTVRLRAGRHLTGSLVLRSGVTLQLDRDAVLLGSPRIADYRRGAKWPALLIAVDATDLAVTGEGTIDGQGAAVAADSLRIYDSGRLTDFFPGVQPGETVNLGGDVGAARIIDPHALQAAGQLAAVVAPRLKTDLTTWRVDESVRPQLLEFSRCRRVRVSGITLQHAANWIQCYRMCEDVELRGLRVRSTTYWNNDGADLVNCRRVQVADCDLDVADDGICLKSELNAAGLGCEDITIERCRIRSSASAVKFGTASFHAFRRVAIRDLDVRDTYRTAVALETVDGAVLEDIHVQRVKARHSGGAFFLRRGQRQPDRPPGPLRRVVLEDFDVEVPATKPDAGYPHEGPPSRVAHNPLPAVIAGLPDAPVEDVTLRRIRVTHGGQADPARAAVAVDALDTIPENRSGYPEFNMFGELPAWGLFVRDVHGLRLEEIALQLAAPDFRRAVVIHRAENIDLARVDVAPGSGAPVAVLAAVRGPGGREVTAPAGTPVLEAR